MAVSGSGLVDKIFCGEPLGKSASLIELERDNLESYRKLLPAIQLKYSQADSQFQCCLSLIQSLESRCAYVEGIRGVKIPLSRNTKYRLIQFYNKAARELSIFDSSIIKLENLIPHIKEHLGMFERRKTTLETFRNIKRAKISSDVNAKESTVTNKDASLLRSSTDKIKTLEGIIKSLNKYIVLAEVFAKHEISKYFLRLPSRMDKAFANLKSLVDRHRKQLVANGEARSRLNVVASYITHNYNPLPVESEVQSDFSAMPFQTFEELMGRETQTEAAAADDQPLVESKETSQKHPPANKDPAVKEKTEPDVGVFSKLPANAGAAPLNLLPETNTTPDEGQTVKTPPKLDLTDETLLEKPKNNSEFVESPETSPEVDQTDAGLPKAASVETCSPKTTEQTTAVNEKSVVRNAD